MDWLDPLDAAMMTAEVSNPLNIGAALILSPPANTGPGYVDGPHRDALTGREPLDPQLRRYPHRGVETGGIWVWRGADTVDLSQHCKRSTPPPQSGRDGLWRLVSELHAEPLDRSRPMWMSHLIDGLDGRFAFYIKAHHTVMDGVAGFQMIADALSADPNRRGMPAFYADRRGRESTARAAHDGLRLPNPVPALRSLVGTAASGIALAERLVTGELSNVVASLKGDTTLPPLAAPYTRFNGRLGHERAVAAASWSKNRIQALQRKAGVTGNDAVTAIVAGVLRAWLLERRELPKKSLVALCPITRRGHHERTRRDRHGNMFGAWLCPLGTNVEGPAERLDLIHRSMAEGKQQVANRGAAASLLSLATTIAPTVLLPTLPFAPKVRTGYNLPISHVPGPSTKCIGTARSSRRSIRSRRSAAARR